MATVVTMGNVYAMRTTMELTAQVNQFCYSNVNGFENFIQLDSEFEVDVTFLIYLL